MKYLVAVFFFLASCGTEVKEKYIPSPRLEPSRPPAQPTPPNTGIATYREVAPLIQESCGLAGCHAGSKWLLSEQELKKGRSARDIRERIKVGNMPPSYAPNYSLWQDGTRKKTILEFLEN